MRSPYDPIIADMVYGSIYLLRPVDRPMSTLKTTTEISMIAGPSVYP